MALFTLALNCLLRPGYWNPGGHLSTLLVPADESLVLQILTLVPHGVCSHQSFGKGVALLALFVWDFSEDLLSGAYPPVEGVRLFSW